MFSDRGCQWASSAAADAACLAAARRPAVPCAAGSVSACCQLRQALVAVVRAFGVVGWGRAAGLVEDGAGALLVGRLVAGGVLAAVLLAVLLGEVLAGEARTRHGTGLPSGGRHRLAGRLPGRVAAADQNADAQQHKQAVAVPCHWIASLSRTCARGRSAPREAQIAEAAYPARQRLQIGRPAGRLRCVGRIRSCRYRPIDRPELARREAAAGCTARSRWSRSHRTAAG